jgi:hypothetical protein
MPRDGAIIFADLIGKLDMLRVATEKSGLAALALPRLCSLLGVAIELLEFPLSFGAAIRRMNSLVLVVLAHFMQSPFYARCLRSTGLEMEHLRELE